MKKDSKKHKKMCSKLAVAEQSNKLDHLSEDELKVFLSHKVGTSTITAFLPPCPFLGVSSCPC